MTTPIEVTRAEKQMRQELPKWEIYLYTPNATYSQWSVVMWKDNDIEYRGWGESPEEAFIDAKRNARLL